ncbi:acyl-CoA dehydrogenase family protein [Pseudonocardia sp.]|jgi:alkylation response protein AidB-like acyl-CoA dehydrogenase|uniref:acyl-CoA dehydrogenase family protein n=1 Tax=Pseudonocardia sp. TaxID=60912 RepID=UPI003D1221AE
MGSSDIAAELNAWLDENWSDELTVRQWWRLLAEAGWAFPTWPAGYGGRAESSAVALLVQDVLLRRQLIGPPHGIAVTMLAPTVLRHGTLEQKQNILPRIVRGELTSCQLFSEPGAGSDLAGLQTSARLVDGEWVVNGQKVWNSHAHDSDLGMLLARTNPTAPKHDGISFLLIPMVQAGVDVRPLRQMNDEVEFNEVFLTDAHVPRDNVLGEVDAGWRVTQTTLGSERSALPARALTPPAGERPGWLDRVACEVYRELQATGSKAKELYPRSGNAARRLAQQVGKWDDQVVRDRVMQLHVLSEANRALTRRLGVTRIAGAPSIVKLAAADLARNARDIDLDILGSAALLSGPDAAMGGEIELMALSAHKVSIGGGTDQIQKNILSERVLGLPKEKRDRA